MLVQYSTDQNETGLGELGIIPLILAAGAGAGGAVAVEQSWSDGWLGAAGQWFGIKDTPAITTPPALRAPSAPQTRWAMVNWSPEMQGEVLRHTADFYRGSGVPSPYADGGDKSSVPWGLILTLGAGAALIARLSR